MFRFAQPIRFSHCDPAGVLYFPHVFDFVNAAMEDWFAWRLGLPFHVMHLELRRGNPVVAGSSISEITRICAPHSGAFRGTRRRICVTMAHACACQGVVSLVMADSWNAARAGVQYSGLRTDGSHALSLR
ncbi:MAG TPA: hypothetical protein VFI89_08740 [Burkholderiales bacterium]|nr:hypothetical protein [Burkholderiales bacterium]